MATSMIAQEPMQVHFVGSFVSQNVKSINTVTNNVINIELFQQLVDRAATIYLLSHDEGASSIIFNGVLAKNKFFQDLFIKPKYMISSIKTKIGLY